MLTFMPLRPLRDGPCDSRVYSPISRRQYGLHRRPVLGQWLRVAKRPEYVSVSLDML